MRNELDTSDMEKQPDLPEMPGLPFWRKQLDEIDLSLRELLAQRRAITSNIGRYKAARGLKVYDPEREKIILDTLQAADPLIAKLWPYLLTFSRAGQYDIIEKINTINRDSSACSEANFCGEYQICFYTCNCRQTLTKILECMHVLGLMPTELKVERKNQMPPDAAKITFNLHSVAQKSGVQVFQRVMHEELSREVLCLIFKR